MKVPTLDTTVPNITDVYADVANALPIDTVVDVLSDLPFDEATDAVVEVGERGRRGAVTVVHFVRRRPLATLVTATAVGAAIAALLLVLRRGSDDSETKLELADAA